MLGASHAPHLHHGLLPGTCMTYHAFTQAVACCPTCFPWKTHNETFDMSAADQPFHRGMERTGSGHSLASHDAKVRCMLWHGHGSGAAAASLLMQHLTLCHSRGCVSAACSTAVSSAHATVAEGLWLLGTTIVGLPPCWLACVESDVCRKASPLAQARQPSHPTRALACGTASGTLTWNCRCSTKQTRSTGCRLRLLLPIPLLLRWAPSAEHRSAGRSIGPACNAEQLTCQNVGSSVQALLHGKQPAPWQSVVPFIPSPRAPTGSVQQKHVLLCPSCRLDMPKSASPGAWGCTYARDLSQTQDGQR